MSDTIFVDPWLVLAARDMSYSIGDVDHRYPKRDWCWDECEAVDDGLLTPVVQGYRQHPDYKQAYEALLSEGDQIVEAVREKDRAEEERAVREWQEWKAEQARNTLSAEGLGL